MSAEPHHNKQQRRSISIPYTKLFPVFVCIAVVAIINLLKANIVKIPVYSISKTDNYAFAINNTRDENKTSLLPTKQINKIVEYLHTYNVSAPAVFSNKNVTEYYLKPMDADLFKAIPLKHSNTVNKAQVSKPNDTEYQQYISLLIQRSSEFKESSFYQYLKEYGLELQLLSLKPGQSFISYPINDHFMIYPKLKTIEYFLCASASGFGNGLSVYWGVRSLAYWMNFNFKISCSAYYNNVEKHKLMSAFLPSSVGAHMHMDITSNIMQGNRSVITFYPLIDRDPKQHSVIHPTSLFFLYCNPYFQKIMNYETMNAMYRYYNYNKRNESIKQMDAMMETNDIVIHVRCGDVLQIMHRVNDWDYGFLTLNHYKYVMETGLERAFGINWYKQMTNDTTVWILSQLTQKAARHGELQSLKDCDFLINYIVDHGLRDIFKPANVKVMYDSDVNDDFYRMVNAPLLFCSPSTYCLNAAIANTNGLVVIPSRGAWVGFFHIDHKNRTVYDQDEEDFIVAQNSKLIPNNQLIIDTEKARWHCNKIDNYKFNQHTYNQNTYAHKLAEYLVSH